MISDCLYFPDLIVSASREELTCPKYLFYIKHQAPEKPFAQIHSSIDDFIEMP